MSGQWLNWLNIITLDGCSHQNSIAALLFSLWLHLEMQNGDSRVMDSCTQLTRSPGGFLYGRHRWKVGRSWGEDPSVESWSSRVTPPRMRREGKTLQCQVNAFYVCYAPGRSAERWTMLALHIDRWWTCSSSWCAWRRVELCNEVQILGGQLGASVRGEKMRKDAAPRGMVEKVLWVHRCHDVSQVLQYSCNRLSFHREV